MILVQKITNWSDKLNFDSSMLESFIAQSFNMNGSGNTIFFLYNSFSLIKTNKT